MKKAPKFKVGDSVEFNLYGVDEPFDGTVCDVFLCDGTIRYRIETTTYGNVERDEAQVKLRNREESNEL